MQNELPENIKNQIEKGIEIIRKGGVIAFPTDTVYGLGTGIYLDSGIKRIYEIKQRPLTLALPLLLADASQIHEIALDIPPYAWKLVKQFLPGGLTLVVYRTKIVKDIITAGGDTVAIRIPNHPVPHALIKGSGMPLIGTSANLSGKQSLVNAEAVRQELGDSVDLVIDGFPVPGGTESTVVDVTGEIPVILREGAITRAEIAAITEVA
jgi:L-threonylcarbamoyladenylate synthase